MESAPLPSSVSLTRRSSGRRPVQNCGAERNGQDHAPSVDGVYITAPGTPPERENRDTNSHRNGPQIRAWRVGRHLEIRSDGAGDCALLVGGVTVGVVFDLNHVGVRRRSYSSVNVLPVAAASSCAAPSSSMFRGTCRDYKSAGDCGYAIRVPGGASSWVVSRSASSPAASTIPLDAMPNSSVSPRVPEDNARSGKLLGVVELSQAGDDLSDLVADIDFQAQELVRALDRLGAANLADAHVDALEVLEADAVLDEWLEVGGVHVAVVHFVSGGFAAFIRGFCRSLAGLLDPFRSSSFSASMWSSSTVE